MAECEYKDCSDESCRNNISGECKHGNTEYCERLKGFTAGINSPQAQEKWGDKVRGEIVEMLSEPDILDAIKYSVKECFDDTCLNLDFFIDEIISLVKGKNDEPVPNNNA